MGRIMEALHRLNELDSTSNKQKEFKYKLHFPGYELSDENELDDKGNPINVNDDPNEEPIYKKRRLPSSYIYVLTQADPVTKDPDMRLCKIGYAQDTDVRLANFNGNTSNSSPNIDWYARVPIYYGYWDDKANKGKGAFLPFKGKTDQLDKRMHDIIDTVVNTAQEFMKNYRDSDKDIDLRIKNDNTGRYKEWYRMSPKDAVRILATVLNANAPTSMYGTIEMNTEHKYYDPNIMTKSYNRHGHQRSQQVKTTGIDRTGTKQAKSAPTTFADLHIPVGAKLKYKPMDINPTARANSGTEVTVVDDNSTVRLPDGRELKISAAAKELGEFKSKGAFSVFTYNDGEHGDELLRFFGKPSRRSRMEQEGTYGK